jgi:hypothetical protein
MYKHYIYTVAMNEKKSPTWAMHSKQQWTRVSHLQTRESTKLSHVS